MAEQGLFNSQTLARLTLVQGWRQKVRAGACGNTSPLKANRRRRETTCPRGLALPGFFRLDCLVCGTAPPAFQVDHLTVASPRAGPRGSTCI